MSSHIIKTQTEIFPHILRVMQADIPTDRESHNDNDIQTVSQRYRQTQTHAYRDADNKTEMHINKLLDSDTDK